MNRRLSCAILSTICWLAMTATGIAGPYDVTFQMPLNLTRIGIAITKVKVVCQVMSDALPFYSIAGVTGTIRMAEAMTELAVSGAQVVTTATVVVPVTTLDTSNGKTSASYKCYLQGYSTIQMRYNDFRDQQAYGE